MKKMPLTCFVMLATIAFSQQKYLAPNDELVQKNIAKDGRTVSC